MKTVKLFEPIEMHENAACSIHPGEPAGKSRPWHYAVPIVFLVAALFLSPICRAQAGADEPKGIDAGGYNIKQTIEAGYRGNWISGNQLTYDTFVDLAQGFRLFDYSVEMRSLDQRGFLFDNLYFSNFGYGGDPNDVTRLRIQKNKWYDFSLLFRRDKNSWDWSLMANPLNPASSVVPTPIQFSPHALDLVRRMQDYSLTLLPQSKIRFRLGYSRNVNEGPAFTTLDGGTEPLLNQNYQITTNSYHAGVDFRFLPKTTFSYDQFLKYFKQDTITFDQIPQSASLGLGLYQLSNGTPVDLGIVWTATAGGGAPCGAPVTDPTTDPPTVKSNCNGYFNGTAGGLPLPGYLKSAHPRNFMPTERFSFQTSYFRRLEMSGAIGYSSGNNDTNDFVEAINGFTSRSLGRGSLTTGPAQAKRVSVNADWNGVYELTDKLRIVDAIRYDNWRIPGTFTSIAGNFFGATPAPPAPLPNGMLLPISILDATTFPATCFATGVPATSFNQVGCPQHSSSSLADFESQLYTRFLGQNLISNTFQVEYDFNRRYSGRIGYYYANRKISDFTSVFDNQESYLPGGTGGTAANLFFAARADCAFPAAPAPQILPPNCTLDPVTGIITEIGLDAGSDESRNITTINENFLLLGVTARPIDTLRITGDFEFGYNDNSFTRISPRQVQVYKIHANYRPRPWATIDGAIDLHNNRDNVSGFLDCPTTADPTLVCPAPVNDIEHDRMYSFSTVLSPSPRLSVDFGYNYWNFYAQADICYASSLAGQPTTPCPSGSASPVPLGAKSVYQSTNHYAYGEFLYRVVKRVTVGLGFNGSFVRGTSNYFNQPEFVATGTPPPSGMVALNGLTPAGTLDFDYLKPFGTVSVDIYKGLSYKMAWNYYGYIVAGPADPAALAPINPRGFNGNLATFSFRYAF